MHGNLTRSERRLYNRLLAPGERSRTEEAEALRDAEEQELQKAKEARQQTKEKQ